METDLMRAIASIPLRVAYAIGAAGVLMVLGTVLVAEWRRYREEARARDWWADQAAQQRRRRLRAVQRGQIARREPPEAA